LYGSKMVHAHKFIRSHLTPLVHEIPYDGEPLYNILMKNHSTVRVNHLICETLDPTSILGQLYANNLLTDKHVAIMNTHMLQQHKKNKKKLFSRLLYKM